MKKKRSRILIFLLIALCFTGCSIVVEEKTDNEEKTNEYSIYSLNSEETELVKSDYFPEEETADYMVRDLMQRLGDKSSDNKQISLLPAEVKINSYEIQGDVLIITFNKGYSKMSRAKEILVRAGIVRNFTQISGIRAVRFMAGDTEIVDSRNQPMGEMTADMFVDYSGEDLESYRYDTFILYFTDKTGTKLVEEQRNVYYKKTLPKEKVVLEQLAKGPMVKGNYPVIPDSAQTLGVVTADNVCYVNMDGSLRDYALEVSEEVSVYAIVNSLLNVCAAEKVQISIEGDSSGTFGGEMPLYSFYQKNEELVEKAAG